jgi:hypothetical protein
MLWSNRYCFGKDNQIGQMIYARLLEERGENTARAFEEDVYEFREADLHYWVIDDGYQTVFDTEGFFHPDNTDELQEMIEWRKENGGLYD